MKHSRFATALGAISLAVVLALTGCSAPVTAPTDPGTTDPGTSTDPGEGTPSGEFMVDPAFPWPAEYPRPNNIVGEFSSKNPLGEGAVRSIEFTATKAEAEAYVAALIDAGFEFGFGMSDAVVEDGGSSVSWLLTTDKLMGTVSTENGNDAAPLWTLSLLG